MAPRHSTKPFDPDAWWKNAYKDLDNIFPTFEFTDGKDVVKPGQMIRIKGLQGTFKFRCLATNTKLDVTWIDCIETKTGHHRAFYVDRYNGIVKPKKSRRKKPIE